MASPLMSRRREADALQKIRSLAQSIPRKVPYSGPPKQPQLLTPLPNALNLPSPEPLTSQFVSLGVDIDSARRISSAFVHVAQQFKESCETSYRRRLQELQSRAQYFQDAKFYSSILSAYDVLYKRSLHSWSSYLATTIVPRVLRAQASLKGELPPFQRRRSFNQNATPVLERFFETNAFPSRLEKCELASDCDMDFKQIHVWFQNRRSRCRKEGREPRRRNSDDDILRTLENTVVDTLLPPTPPEEESESTGDAFEFNEIGVRTPPFLPLRAPPHAFPTPYPPPCSDDPFPSSPTTRSLQLPWLRQPTGELKVTPQTDLFDVIASFAKLSIANTNPADNSPQVRRSQQSLRDVVGFVTQCPCAPHPALVRRPRLYARGTCSATRSVSSASPHGCMLSTSIHRRKATCLDPSSPTNRPLAQPKDTESSPATRRVKRGLPRRVPQHSPRYTETTVLSDSPAATRASSVTSVSSSFSRSDTESPPSTPRSHSGCDPLIFDQSEESGPGLGIFDFLHLSLEQRRSDDIDTSKQHLVGVDFVQLSS